MGSLIRWLPDRVNGGAASAAGVVIVEQDRPLRARLAEAFAEQDPAVRVAADGTELVQLLTRSHEGDGADHRIRLAIIDVDAPGRSGLDVAAMVREREWPVVVLVTWRANGIDLRDAILRVGASALRRRPVSVEDWAALIGAVRYGSLPREANCHGEKGPLIEKLAQVLLALWLIASVFLWRHSRAQEYNALVVGALAAVVASAVLGHGTRSRPAMVVLGAWLVVSTALLRWQAPATLWNHLLVGVALLALGAAAIRRAAPPFDGAGKRPDPS
jgi:DNA-binding response OmpR family regulator